VAGIEPAFATGCLIEITACTNHFTPYILGGGQDWNVRDAPVYTETSKRIHQIAHFS